MHRLNVVALAAVAVVLTSCASKPAVSKKPRHEEVPPAESYRLPPPAPPMYAPPPAVSQPPPAATPPSALSTSSAGGGGAGATSEGGRAADTRSQIDAAGDATGSGSDAQGVTGDAGNPGVGSGPGAGHVDPWSDPTQRLTAPAETLEIPRALSDAAGASEEEPADEPAEPTPAGRAAAPDAEVETLVTQMSSEDIERLPPERRAAVLRYLKAMQNRRAPQPAGGE